MQFLKKVLLPIVPVKFVATLLLKRFVTQFMERPVDLDLIQFNGDCLTLTNIEIKCSVRSLLSFKILAAE